MRARVTAVASGFAEAECAREPEERSGEEGDVHAGDDEEVEGAGALKAEAKGVGEAGAIAEEHGIEHAGVVRGEAQELGQAAIGEGVGEVEKAIGRPRLER